MVRPLTPSRHAYRGACTDILNVRDRLCDVRFTVAPAEMNLSRVSTNRTDGDFNATQLAEVVNTDDLNEEIVRVWRERAGTPLS